VLLSPGGRLEALVPVESARQPLQPLHWRLRKSTHDGVAFSRRPHGYVTAPGGVHFTPSALRFVRAVWNEAKRFFFSFARR